MSASCLEHPPTQRGDGTPPIRVLVLRSVDGPGGGAESIVLRTACSVDPRRIQLTVCCIHRPDDPQYDFDRRSAAAGIDYLGVHQHSLLARGVLDQLRQIVRQRAIEIVDAQDYKAAYFAWRLALCDGILPAGTLHGWSGHHWRERCVYYPAEKLLVGRFPLVIAVSGEIARSMRRWGAGRAALHVLANGIDPHDFQPQESVRRDMRTALGIGRDELVVGAVGRLEEEKRYDVLLEAFARVYRRLPTARLLLVGAGSRRTALQSQLDRAGLTSACRLLGHRQDVRELYQAFDVFVQSSDHEGSPTVVVEAMALRVPVVATAVGGTGDLVRDNQEGLLAPRRDPAALALAIERTLVDRTATSIRVEAARLRVESTLSFAARTRTLEDLYCQAAAQFGSRPRGTAGAVLQDWARNPHFL